MWENAGNWLINNYGAGGIVILALAAVIVALASAVVYIFKKYTALQTTHSEQLQAQAEKCRDCMEQLDTRHDQAMHNAYEIMRSENHKILQNMEQLIERSTAALMGVTGKLGELSGKLDAIGRHA